MKIDEAVEREKFEAWANRVANHSIITTLKGGVYVHRDARIAWATWQAALEKIADPCRHGYHEQTILALTDRVETLTTALRSALANMQASEVAVQAEYGEAMTWEQIKARDNYADEIDIARAALNAKDVK